MEKKKSIFPPMEQMHTLINISMSLSLSVPNIFIYKHFTSRTSWKFSLKRKKKEKRKTYGPCQIQEIQGHLQCLRI